MSLSIFLQLLTFFFCFKLLCIFYCWGYVLKISVDLLSQMNIIWFFGIPCFGFLEKMFSEHAFLLDFFQNWHWLLALWVFFSNKVIWICEFVNFILFWYFDCSLTSKCSLSSRSTSGVLMYACSYTRRSCWQRIHISIYMGMFSSGDTVPGYMNVLVSSVNSN